MLHSRIMPVLLTWNAIAAFSEECVTKLVHRVLLLYLVVSSALEQGWEESCKALLMQPFIGLLASIVFNNNHGWSLPTCWVCLWFCMQQIYKNVHHDNYDVCIKLLLYKSNFDTSTEASAPAVLSLLFSESVGHTRSVNVRVYCYSIFPSV